MRVGGQGVRRHENMNKLRFIAKILGAVVLIFVCFTVLDWLFDTPEGWDEKLLKSVLALCAVYGCRALYKLRERING